MFEVEVDDVGEDATVVVCVSSVETKKNKKMTMMMMMMMMMMRMHLLHDVAVVVLLVFLHCLHPYRCRHRNHCLRRNIFSHLFDHENVFGFLMVVVMLPLLPFVQFHLYLSLPSFVP